jgi:hypothetical protein
MISLLNMPYISTTSSPIIPRVNLTIPQNLIKVNYIPVNPPCSQQPITNDPATLPTSWVHRSGRAGLLELLVLVPALPRWKGPPWCLLVQFWEHSLETALVEHIETTNQFCPAPIPISSWPVSSNPMFSPNRYANPCALC